MKTIYSRFQEDGEKILLVLYFLIMVVVTWQLFLILGEAWRGSELFRPAVLALDPLLSVNLEQFSAFMFGVYGGLLTLLTLDPKKRWQGLLLWIGTVSGLMGLLSIGLFIPNIDFLQNLFWIGLGFSGGVIIGGGRKLMEIRTAEALEFRRSATLLFYFITAISIVGILEYHVNFPQLLEVTSQEVVFLRPESTISVDWSGFLVNASMTAVLIVTMRRFVQYDASESFFILGPPGSGKSLFLVGTYLAALDEATNRQSDTPLNPSGDLMELVGELDAASQDSGWQLDSTGATDVQDLRFRFIKGKVFPKNIELASLDYAGEYLEELPNALMGAKDEIDNSTLQLLGEQVRLADTIIFVIDVERFYNNETLGIEPYFDILNAASGKDVILVATKCDILAEQFREEKALEAHQYFGEFQEFVNERLVMDNQTIRTLVQDTSEAEIHPVYYQTTLSEDGERVPMRDRHGNVTTVGFDELLNKLG